MPSLPAVRFGSPEILPVDDSHRPIRRFKIIEQSRVDADFPCLPVPASVGFERRGIGVQVAPAGAAEMIGDLLGVPAVDSIAVGLRHGELIRLEIGIEMTAFRTERAGTARELLRQFAVDLECGAATVAVCDKCHYKFLCAVDDPVRSIAALNTAACASNARRYAGRAFARAT